MTTLLQLRTRCKEESDNVNSSFISDSEWNDYINDAYGAVYGQLAQAFGSRYFVQSPSTGYLFTTDGTNQQFALPADFFKLLNVSVQVTSPQQWVSLRPFPMADVNVISLFNTQIPAAGQTVRLFYVPRVTLLSGDSDTIADAVSINRWDALIVAKACVKAMRKEESDITPYLITIKEETERIDAESESRDAGNPSRIVDTYGRRARSMQYALFGSNLYLVGGATPGWWWDLGDWGPTSDFYGGGPDFL